MTPQKPSVYIDSSIPSYLTARVSNDAIVAGHQFITWLWWELGKDRYDRYVSSLVHDEIARGDSEFAKHRLEIVQPLNFIAVPPEAIELGEVYLRRLPIPRKAEADALHIATATFHEMDYLVTWNQKHMANAIVRERLLEINEEFGLDTPAICTPEVLLYEE
jgi:hypothetical protein